MISLFLPHLGRNTCITFSTNQIQTKINGDSVTSIFVHFMNFACFFLNFFFEFSLTYDYVDILRLAIVNNLVLFFETHLKTDLIEDFFSILIVMKFVHVEFLI